MLGDRRRALGLAALLLAGAVTIGLLVAIPTTRHAVQDVDGATRRLAVRIQNGPTTGVADTLSFVGGAWVTWTLRVLACGVLAIRRHWLSLSAFALAVASSEVLIGTLKAAYDRHRPPGGLIATHGASFPSGHAVAAAVTAIGIVLALLPPGRARRRWVACAVGFVVAMALSRVYLRAHWLSDAAAGALLGAGLALGWPALLQTVRGMHQPAQATADPKRPCKNASS